MKRQFALYIDDQPFGPRRLTTRCRTISKAREHGAKFLSRLSIYHVIFRRHFPYVGDVNGEFVADFPDTISDACKNGAYARALRLRYDDY